MKYSCRICKKELEESEAYEYRGAVACEQHFEQAQNDRNWERAEVIEDNRLRTDKFKGLSFGDSVVGRANKEILKGAIEVAKKEPMRTTVYERGDLPLTNNIKH